MGKRRSEWFSTGLFGLCASIAVIAIAGVIVFVGRSAYQTFTVDKVNPAEFFFSPKWFPDDGQAGALALIVGSAFVTVLAVLISTPISVGIALFVTEVAPVWARQFMQPVLELLTGIPSIIFGFLGLELLVPLIANYAPGLGFRGYGAITASVVLALMILPTITTLSIDALGSLPNGLREASLALGATRWQSMRKTLIPSAAPGIFTGIILGTGRAIGETLAVSFVIGGAAGFFPIQFKPDFPYIFVPPSRTITVELLTSFKEAEPHTLLYDGIWTLAFVLLIISLLLVVASRWIQSRSVYSPNRPSKSGGRNFFRALARMGAR